MSKEEIKTTVKPNTYNNRPMFAVYKAVAMAESGEPIFADRPAFNIGIAKARLAIKHLEELKKFVAENEGY